MNKLSVSGIIVLAAVLLSINLNKPFIGQHDWNGVVYGQQAKNFYRYGFIPLKFGATMATPDVSVKDRIFQIHYSPALPILISFSYRLFGVSEWSTRLIPVSSSIASLVLVMLLGRELISFRAGIMAGFLLAVTPMFIYYGKNPVHEVVLLPFALLGFYSYSRWRRSREEKWWKILLVSLTFAMLIGWSGYYAAGLIAGHGFLTGGKSRSRFLVLPAITGCLFLAFLFHVSVFSPNVDNELWRAVTARIGGGGFGIKEFMARELRDSINLFTATLLGLVGIWTVRLPRSGTSNVPPFAMTVSNQILLGLIGIFGIFHVLLFRDAGWYHEYLLFPFLPFVVLAAAGVIYRAKLLIIFIILVLAAVERVGYAKALINSEYVRDIYEEAVEVGKIVQFQPSVIVPAERDVYFVFYADTVRKK